MSEPSYFVISPGESDTRVEKVTRDVLLKRIEEKYYGDHAGFLERIEENDTNYWGDNILIIKGEIVVPRIATMVVK